MRVRLQMREQMSTEAYRDWLLNEVNKDVTPGRKLLKVTFWLVLFILLVAVMLMSSPRFHSM